MSDSIRDVLLAHFNCLYLVLALWEAASLFPCYIWKMKGDLFYSLQGCNGLLNPNSLSSKTLMADLGFLLRLFARGSWSGCAPWPQCRAHYVQIFLSGQVQGLPYELPPVRDAQRLLVAQDSSSFGGETNFNLDYVISRIPQSLGKLVFITSMCTWHLKGFY